MFKVVAVHSFRGGTGKSNITANLAVMAAAAGKRVGLVDTDLQSPGIHILFGLEQQQVAFCLNDYLWERCEIDAAFYDVTPSEAKAQGGILFLSPASFKAEEMTRVVQEGYDMTRLSGGLNDLAERLQLDYLFVDTHPGFNHETLLLMAVADEIVIVLRPDSQDFQGTAVTVTLAHELQVPKLLMVVNKVLPALEPEAIRQLVEKTYREPVAGILPACDEMMLLGSRGIFCLKYPNHPLTAELKTIAQKIL